MCSRSLVTSVLLIAAAACAAIAPARTADAQTPRPSLLVSTDWLAQRLGDPAVVVLHVSHDSTDFARGHIPGARPLSYDAIRVTRDSIGTELPPADALRRTFEALGVSSTARVVVYAGGNGMAPMAARVFLSLDHLGHDNVALLDGGLAKWRAEKRVVSTTATAITPGQITTRPRAVTVSADDVRAATGRPGFAFLDTRTTPEYVGAGTRSGLPSEGHVAGARQLEWEQLFRDAGTGEFLPLDQLQRLFAERAQPGDTVITYCLVGYRASMTYFAARLLGYEARLYDGSYQEWARKSLPVVKGATP